MFSPDCFTEIEDIAAGYALVDTSNGKLADEDLGKVAQLAGIKQAFAKYND